MLWCGLFCKFIIICLNEFVYLFTLELTVHFNFVIDYNSWVFRNSEILSLNITSVPFFSLFIWNLNEIWLTFLLFILWTSYLSVLSILFAFCSVLDLFFFILEIDLSPISQVTCFIFVPDSNFLLNPLKNCQLTYFLG